MKFVIITGVSGAGKSLVVKFMEDLGYFCVDNLPPALIPKIAEIAEQSGGRMEKIALVMDIRGGEFFDDLIPGLERLAQSGISYEIVFLEASDAVLTKRFKEARRNHPLSPEGRVMKGINEERMILKPLRSIAQHIIDTSNLLPAQLKEEIHKIFVKGAAFKGLIINIISFGFKYGLPIDSDLVLDVRFITNPYYIETLKKFSGKNEAVKEYVLKSRETIVFLEKIRDLLEFLIPNYIKEGKTQLVIGIGCTGGRHRSVAIADALAEILKKKEFSVIIDHRDLDRDPKNKL